MSAGNTKRLRVALDYLDHGDWDAAHKIVQSDESPEGCWIHAIVHVMEGDLANARYWYGRAKRRFSDNAASEIAAVKAVL
jgi:Tfp pilus assembly protein PilF